MHAGVWVLWKGVDAKLRQFKPVRAAGTRRATHSYLPPPGLDEPNTNADHNDQDGNTGAR